VERTASQLLPLKKVFKKIPESSSIVCEDLPVMHSFSWQRERAIRERRRVAVKRTKRPPETIVYNEGYKKKYIVRGVAPLDSDSSSAAPPSSKDDHTAVKRSYCSTVGKQEYYTGKTQSSTPASSIAQNCNPRNISSESECSSSDSTCGYIVGSKSFRGIVHSNTASVSSNSKPDACSLSNNNHDSLKTVNLSFCNGPSRDRIKQNHDKKSIIKRLLRLRENCSDESKDLVEGVDFHNSNSNKLAFLRNNVSHQEIRKSNRFRRKGIPYPRQKSHDYQPVESFLPVTLNLSLMSKTRLFQEGECPEDPKNVQTKEVSEKLKSRDNTKPNHVKKSAELQLNPENQKSAVQSQSVNNCSSERRMPCSSTTKQNNMEMTTQSQEQLHQPQLFPKNMMMVPFYGSSGHDNNNDLLFAPAYGQHPQHMLMLNATASVFNSDVMKQLNAFFIEPGPINQSSVPIAPSVANKPMPSSSFGHTPLNDGPQMNRSESVPGPIAQDFTKKTPEISIEDKNNNDSCKAQASSASCDIIELTTSESEVKSSDENADEEDLAKLNSSQKLSTKLPETKVSTTEDKETFSGSKNSLVSFRKFIGLKETNKSHVGDNPANSTSIVDNHNSKSESRPEKNQTEISTQRESIEVIELDDSDMECYPVKKSSLSENVRIASVLNNEHKSNSCSATSPAPTAPKFKADLSTAFLSMLQSQKVKRREVNKYFSGSLDKTPLKKPSEVVSLISSSSDEECRQQKTLSYSKGRTKFFFHALADSHASTPHDYWVNYSDKCRMPLSHVVSLMLKAGEARNLSFFTGQVSLPDSEEDVRNGRSVSESSDTTQQNGSVFKKRRLF